MKAGKYNIKEFFVNRYLQKIIVPEIQRDYVWGESQVKGLLQTLSDDYKEYLNAVPPIKLDEEPELALDFFKFYKKRKYVSNIGFIYAYNDSEYAGKYFLIDGQQRITTIYILLLILANRNESIREHFKRTFLLDEANKLDYKVREAAHEFLNSLTSYMLDGKNNITDQLWMYEDYNNDRTIITILNNIKVLQKELDKLKFDEPDFYNYLCDYLEFWYFVTNISEQGEELYIYMNARGEQMQSNENIKADLLSKLTTIDSKNNYGKKWEQWQDFFWQHRAYKDSKGSHENENADKGFNEFLCCISGLENLINNLNRFYSKDDFEKKNKIETIDIIASLDLNRIEKYVLAIQYLENNKEAFKNQYFNYNKWVDNCLSDIWLLFNNENTNWFANYTDANRASERNRMVFIWSFLYFLTKIGIENLNLSETFRFLRLFYLRYYNFNRSVSTLLHTIGLIRINGVFDSIEHQLNSNLDEDGKLIEIVIDEETDSSSRTKEERLKIDLLNRYLDKSDIQKRIEELIWEIEDHKFNLNGKDVGATNISHLIDLNVNITIDELVMVRNKFFALFPKDEKNFPSVQSLLLYYGEYWYRISPYYYFNYEFDNWRRIIRGYTEKNKPLKTYFKDFFKEFCEYGGTLGEFRTDKEEQYAIKEIVNIHSLSEQLIWYNQQLGDNMWSKGNYIALREWVGNDGIFLSQFKIYNTKGDFKGYNNIELFSLLENSVKSNVSAIKENTEDE